MEDAHVYRPCKETTKMTVHLFILKMFSTVNVTRSNLSQPGTPAPMAFDRGLFYLKYTRDFVQNRPRKVFKLF